MAISFNFFGLRRGSTKSLTFSVLRGQQITKDRVQGGANPQTPAQMRQRIAFATVLTASKHLQAVIEMGSDGGKPSLTDFIKRNTALLKQQIATLPDTATITPSTPYVAQFMPKGTGIFVPNNYILSDGSLPTPAYFTPAITTGHGNVLEVSKIAQTHDTDIVLSQGEQYDAQLLVEDLFGLLMGDQITAIAAVPTAYIAYQGDDGQTAFTARLVIHRVAVRETNVPFSVPDNDGDVETAVKNAVKRCFDAAKSSEKLLALMLDAVTIAPNGDGTYNIEVADIATYRLYGNTERVQAFGWLYSHYDEWREQWTFNRCQLRCLNPSWDPQDIPNGKDQPLNNGLDYAHALKTYTTTTATPSSFFARGGSAANNAINQGANRAPAAPAAPAVVLTEIMYDPEQSPILGATIDGETKPIAIRGDGTLQIPIMNKPYADSGNINNAGNYYISIEDEAALDNDGSPWADFNEFVLYAEDAGYDEFTCHVFQYRASEQAFVNEDNEAIKLPIRAYNDGEDAIIFASEATCIPTELTTEIFADMDCIVNSNDQGDLPLVICHGTSPYIFTNADDVVINGDTFRYTPIPATTCNNTDPALYGNRLETITIAEAESDSVDYLWPKVRTCSVESEDNVFDLVSIEGYVIRVETGNGTATARIVERCTL